MFNIQNLFRHALLALALCGTSLAAHADVIPGSFRVTINSAGLPDAAKLDMSFGGFEAAEAIGTVSNLQGAFGPVDLVEGNAAVLPGGVYTLTNQELSYLAFDLTPGGSFSFDVVFSGAFLTEVGDFTTLFTSALLDANYMPLGGEFGDVIFSITQLSSMGAAAIAFETSALGAVGPAEVPEPSELLLMLTGLALLGAMARRRQA